MRRHRANGVVDLVSKYALAAYTQCMQKFLGGEISPHSPWCNGDNVLSFENAGVGALPAGVTKMGMDQVLLRSDIGYDEVEMSVQFDDDKLCQAVASITGSICNDGFVQIGIKHN